MPRTRAVHLVLLVSLVAFLSGPVAGQSPQTRTSPKKPRTPQSKNQPTANPKSATPTDVRIRARYTSGAQVSENTTYLKGSRQRVEFPGVVSIEQCDLGRTVLLSPAAKTYLVKPRAQTTVPAPAVPPTTAAGSAAEPTAVMGRNADSRPPKGGTVTFITTQTDTGERKQVFGHEARHIMTTVIRQPSASACDKTAGTVEVDAWYIDVAGVDRCPVGSAPQPTVTPTSAGCVDQVQTEIRGDAKLGFPVATTTTTKTGEGDKLETSSTSLEVTAFDLTTLEATLFEVPPGYTEVRSSAELLAGLKAGGGLTDALLGSTSDGTSSAAPKAAGAIRLGVVELVDKSAHDLPTRELRQELASAFRKAPFEALTLAGTSPADAQADAARMQCDYVLYAEVTDIKTTRPGKVGSVLKKVSRDGPARDVHEVQLRYSLYPVPASGAAPPFADTARANSGGGFDLHSALHVAVFAGSLYLRFSGFGMLSPMLMSHLAGLGPLAGSGLFDPRMSAVASITQVLLSSAVNGAGDDAATGTSGSADESQIAIRQTVSAALANVATGAMEHLQKPRK